MLEHHDIGGLIQLTMRKKTIIILLVISFLAFGAYTTWRTHNGSTDFDTYYWAAKRAAAGEPIYQEKQGLSPYIYPPIFAVLMTPFTVLSMEAASFIWYAITIALAALAFWLSLRLIFENEKIKDVWDRAPFIPKAAFIAVAAGLLLDNISLLQVNILIFALVLAGLYFFKKGNDILSGLSLAAAISIKLIPILFLVYFIVRRRFKTALFIILWLLFLTILVPALYLGTDNAVQYFSQWKGDTFDRSASVKDNFQLMGSMFNPSNQSVTALMSRWLVKNDSDITHWKTVNYKYPEFLKNINLGISRQWALYLSKIAVLIFLAVTFSLFLGKVKSREDPALNFDYSLVILMCLIANPILKTQHLVFIIFPMMLLLSRSGVSRRGRLLGGGLIAASVLYILIGVKIFKIAGFGALALLALWLVTFMEARNESVLSKH